MKSTRLPFLVFLLFPNFCLSTTFYFQRYHEPKKDSEEVSLSLLLYSGNIPDNDILILVMKTQPPSRCDEFGQPCSRTGNRPQQDVQYVYKEKDGKCIREEVTRRIDNPDSCSCVDFESCPPESIVVPTTFGFEDSTDDGSGLDFLDSTDFIVDDDSFRTDDSFRGHKKYNVRTSRGIRVRVKDTDDMPNGRRRPVPPVRPARKRTSVTSSPSPRCTSSQVCCRKNGINRRGSVRPSIPAEGSCGKRRACGIAPGKILHKKGEANVGEYPWSVSVIFLSESESE